MQRNPHTRGGGSRERACKVCGGFSRISKEYGGTTELSGGNGDYCSWRCLARNEPVETWAWSVSLSRKQDPDLWEKAEEYKNAHRSEVAVAALVTPHQEVEDPDEVARRYGGAY